MDNTPSPSNKKQITSASQARKEKRKLDKLEAEADEHSNCPNSIETCQCPKHKRNRKLETLRIQKSNTPDRLQHRIHLHRDCPNPETCPCPKHKRDRRVENDKKRNKLSKKKRKSNANQAQYENNLSSFHSYVDEIYDRAISSNKDFNTKTSRQNETYGDTMFSDTSEYDLDASDTSNSQSGEDSDDSFHSIDPLRNKTKSSSYKIKECERSIAANTDKVNELRQQVVYSYDDLKKIDESFDFSIKAEKGDIYKSCAVKLAYDAIGNHACAVCDCDNQTSEF